VAISVSASSPEFVSVTVCAALALPTVTVPKLNASGDSASVAAEAPVPVKLAVCTPTESVTENVPVLVPEAFGVNTTDTVHPVCGPSELPHVFALTAKSPLIDTPCKVAATPPVFEIVMFCTALVAPSVTAPKLSPAGVSTIFAGSAPVPDNATVAVAGFGGCPVTFPVPLTVKVPCNAPAESGENLTCTEQVAAPLNAAPMQLSVSANVPGVVVTDPTTSVPPPAFDTVTVCVELCPITVTGNATGPAGSPTPGGANALPESAIVCDRRASETTSVPVAAPAAVGVNTTAIMHEL